MPSRDSGDVHDETREKVIYSVRPVKDHDFVLPAPKLLVVDLFPHNVNLIMLRHPFMYEYCGFIEGDGAIDVRHRRVKSLRLFEVSSISGWGTAVAASFWEKEAAP